MISSRRNQSKVGILGSRYPVIVVGTECSHGRVRTICTRSFTTGQTTDAGKILQNPKDGAGVFQDLDQ